MLLWPSTLIIINYLTLIHFRVHAILPYPSTEAMLDRRMHNLVAYSRKVEAYEYEIADSRVSNFIYIKIEI